MRGLGRQTLGGRLTFRNFTSFGYCMNFEIISYTTARTPLEYYRVNTKDPYIAGTGRLHPAPAVRNFGGMAASVAAAASSTKGVQAVKPVVKDYAWGIRGLDSRVARFALESGSLDEIDPSAPYAELWIGTHPSGESILADGTTLREAVGGELPWLLKILSAGKALSIQAHPDKTLAAKLNAENPDKYRDVNHKPEMAIAL
jgi:hypothetical protein